MTTYEGAWDRQEVRSFLATAEIPVRLACTTPSGHLWMVSLWFRDPDGDDLRIQSATSAAADVVRYLRADPTVAFEISTNEVPYRGIRGRGTASISPDPEKTVLRALIERYLGDAESGLARRLLDPDREEVTVSVDPVVVYSWDFSDRMRDAGE